MKTRLGLDIGTNSIGWALLSLEDGKPSGVIRTGVRIFSDGRNPKDGSSLAVTRRLARQQRRMRDRKLKRQARLMEALSEHGLMPATQEAQKLLEHIDPYAVRARALDELVEPQELGRALFHLAKRRGFKSNRKTDGADSESGVIASSITATREQMEADGARTYGEWLYMRRQRGEGVLARTTGSGKDKNYEVYSDRALTEQEVDCLFEKQRTFGSEACTEEAQDAIRSIILFQRDLLPVSPGKCTFEQGEHRAAQADLRVQEFRIYQELNNLRIINENYEPRFLTLKQRDSLAAELQKRPKLTFVQMRKLLSLKEREQINFEGSRDYLVGNQTNNVIANKKVFGKRWYDLGVATRTKIVESLISAGTDTELFNKLSDFPDISDGDSELLASAALVDGYSRLSLKAIEKILPHLKDEVITYDKAAAKAGYRHSDQYTGEWHKELPYYGEILHQYTGTPSASANEEEARYGRIANPTVHIALNQIRKVVNALIKKYGHPDQIHIEVVRDLKMGQKALRELKKNQKANQERNDRHRQRLKELGHRDTYDNRLRLTLWEELAESPIDRKCPFSGKQIGIESLFTQDIQIEHLIPFADCLDDSQANKTLATRKANNDKGKRTPFEAFGGSEGGYVWSDILDRADRLPQNKRRRFMPQARTMFSGDEWLARQLNDTAYISRVARKYLTAICNPDNVRVTPGRLTALFRRALGLEELLGDAPGKDRSDHRHHAIDAVVVGLTEASLIKTASHHAGKDDIERLSDRLAEMEPPWRTFYGDVERSITRIAVSHKPDHGPEGALHNETAYGIVEPPDEKGVSLIRYRKPISDLKEKDLEKISDTRLANEIREYTQKSSEPFQKAVASFAGVSRSQKCTLQERMSVVEMQDDHGVPYKAYKGDANYCYEIFWVAADKWDGRIVTTFEANQAPYRAFRENENFLRQAADGKPLVMRLCRDDVIAVGERHDRQLFKVVKLSAGRIVLASPHEANADARNRDPEDPFNFLTKSPSALRALSARRVFIDPMGAVRDPGPLSCPAEL